jgi:type IV pilus assembly protein PilF
MSLNTIYANRVSTISFAAMACAVAMFVLSGCNTTSETQTKTADIAGKTTNTQRAQIHTERSAEYYRLNKMAVAIDAAQDAIKSDPNYAAAHSMLGLIYMELKEDAKAQKAFEQAVRVAPEDSDVLNNFGWFICERQSPDRSYTYFERALKNSLYTTPERARYNWGVCARRAGNNTLAETQLREAITRSAAYAPAHYELAEIQFSSMRFREADASLGRYMALVREPPVEALWLAVRIARARNDRDSENTYTMQMRRRFPDAPQTREAFDGRR